MPLVSVIIPCFNAEPYLLETLQSVFSQTYPALEVILVNDGSTDKTRAIIDSLGTRVRAVHGPNQGAAVARNIGTALARGELFQYLDADDLLMPGAIAARVQALKSGRADVAYADWQKLQEEAPGVFQPAELMCRRLGDVHTDPEMATFSSFWSPPAALLYTRAIVEKIGGWKQHLAPIEDARFLQDAAAHGASFVHVPSVMAMYRIFHGPSHSRRSPLKFASAVFANAREIEARWCATGCLHSERQQAVARCYDYCARSFFRHDRALFGAALTDLYRLDPGFRLTWPKLAGKLDSWLGHRGALGLLQALGKRAP